MIIKIKHNNKTVLSAMARQYSRYYFIKACDWFDSKSGATFFTSVDS